MGTGMVAAATGTMLKLSVGIVVGMRMRVVGKVGDGYKYLSGCSCVDCSSRVFTVCTFCLQ